MSFYNSLVIVKICFVQSEHKAVCPINSMFKYLQMFGVGSLNEIMSKYFTLTFSGFSFNYKILPYQ